MHMSELQEKFGKLLKLERERKGLSLADLAAELKISEEYLTAIEAGEVQSLPNELYYNLFAKSYSEYLGVDFVATMEAIKEDIGETRPASKWDGSTNESTEADDAEAEDGESRRSTGPGRKLLIISGAVVAAFVLFLAGYKLFLEGDGTGSHAGTSNGSSADDEAQSERLNAEYASYDWSAVRSEVQDDLRLVLTAREESWATVLADGDTILYQNLTPYREYTVPAKYRLLVSIGVPRVVDVQLNGQPAFLANAESGRISRVEINQVNRESYYETPAPKPVRQSPTPTSEQTNSEQDAEASSGSVKPTQTPSGAASSTTEEKTSEPNQAQPTVPRRLRDVTPPPPLDTAGEKSEENQDLGRGDDTGSQSNLNSRNRPYTGTRPQPAQGQTLTKDSL